MGDTVNFRSHKESYKDKKAVRNDSSNFLVFQNTHEPIIDRRTWYLVQELRKTVRRTNADGEDMKKRLSSIVKEYKFDSVQAFYKEFNAAKREYLEYKAACTEWEKTYEKKVTNPMSIIERLRQKEQIVKEREAGRVHQARQKDKGTR